MLDQLINDLIIEGVNGYKNGINTFMADICIYKNAGYGFGDSVKKSWTDTKRYYNCAFTGKEYKPLKEVVTFIK